MVKQNWIRLSVLTAVIGSVGFAMFLAACGDDDAEPTTPATDASVPDSTTPPPPDASEEDAGEDAATDIPARLILVHGATSLGPSSNTGAVRVCFATATKDKPNDFVVTSTLGALPDELSAGAKDAGLPFPGLFPGTGGPFPSTGLFLDDYVIKPIVLNAERLAARGIIRVSDTDPGFRCNKLLQDGFVPDGGWPDGTNPLANTALQKNVDYWELAPIPATTLVKNKTFLLSVNGCAGDTDPAVGTKCGSDFTAGVAGPGNLKLFIFELDTAAPAADELGAQFVHSSPQTQASVPAVSPGFAGEDLVDAAADAASFQAVTAAPVAFPQLMPTNGVGIGAAPPVAKLKGITMASYFMAGKDAPLNNFRQPLTAIAKQSAAASGYANGKNYTFVAVGDPDPTFCASDNPNLRSRCLHYLAFENDFAPIPAK